MFIDYKYLALFSLKLEVFETNCFVERILNMRYLSLVFLFSAFPLMVFCQNDSTAFDDCEIKKNGIYYAQFDKETNIYIRFHSGDTAVATSSTNNLRKASKFIHKEFGDEMLMGKYFTNNNNCSLRIKAKNDFGKVKMDGFVSNDKLALSIININQNTAKSFVFRFHAIEEKN